jgi:outer membrane protein
MKIGRLPAALLFLAASAASPVFAQPKPAATQPAVPSKPASAQPTAPSSVSVPVGKIVLIYSQDFQDPKNGIARFIAVANKLNADFKGVNDELNQMQQKIQQLTDEITKLQQAPAGTPIAGNTIRSKSEQLEQLKKDYQRKGEDAQAAFNKRRQELFTPLQDDISQALEAYAKAHGITLIIDGSQVPVVYAADSLDITRAFINDYNSKNPATASVTTPKD